MGLGFYQKPGAPSGALAVTESALGRAVYFQKVSWTLRGKKYFKVL